MLRSIKQLYGDRLGTSDGAIGHVKDFYFDDEHWAVRYVVVETGHWYHGREIVISPSHAERISYEESTISVDVTKAAVRDAPEYHMPRARYRDARQFSESMV